MHLPIKLSKNYYKVQKKVNSMPTIGRFGVLIASQLVILLIWFLLFQYPLMQKKSKLNAKLEDIISTSINAKIEIGDIIEKITGEKIKEEKAELSEEAKETEKFLGVLDDEIVSPNEMSEMLRNLLTHEANLKLVSYKIYPKKVLVNAENNVKNHKAKLYEQDVKIQLSGDYFSTLDYLKRLEALPWRIFWDDIQYDVTNYPKAQIIIKIHTLGQ